MFLKPWHAVDGDRRTHLEAALALEIKPGHVLAGRAIHVLAARQDCDDVLCEIGEGSCAIVHMTWSGKAESAPFPSTRVFASFDEWQTYQDSLGDDVW
ncbi:MAG: hypothetical protein ABI551_08650 [Polyangiaceae bacterium]